MNYVKFTKSKLLYALLQKLAMYLMRLCVYIRV